jgi:hypothetical protein
LVLSTFVSIHAKRRVTKLVHGDYDGADQLVKAWGEMRGVPVVPCPADWDKHGRAAGPIRNQGMLDTHKPHGVVAFPGGFGTADMIRRALRANVDVIDVLSSASATSNQE